jgi:hypothetical protein
MGNYLCIDVFNRNTLVDATEKLYFPVVSRVILERGVKGRATLDIRQRRQDPLVQSKMVRVLLEITKLVYKYALITAEGTR